MDSKRDRVEQLVEENKEVLDRLAASPGGNGVHTLHYRIDVDADYLVTLDDEHGVRLMFRRQALACEQELVSCWKRAKAGELEGYNKP